MTRAAYPTSAGNSSDAFEAYVSKPATFRLILLGVGMTALAFWCIGQPGIKAQFAGWVGTPFFALCTLYLITQIGRFDPVLVINCDGVDYRRLGVGLIPWDQIASVTVGEVRRQKFLCFTLLDERPYVQKLAFHRQMWAGLNSLMGFPLLSISFGGTDKTLDDALEALRQFRG